MPIPAFNYNHVLPPHLGNPTLPDHLSPYECTIIEFCQHFATNPIRVNILKNYLRFRERMNHIGIINGFQWLDGSFTENIEVSEKRPPGDLDVVTFYGGVDPSALVKVFPEFASPMVSKATYQLDHYPVDFMYDPYVTVEYTRYWIQLFTHKKGTGLWKGILKLPINTPVEDQDALNYLNSL